MVASDFSSTESTFAISGLRESVEIRIDSWGVPHIYAKSRADVFLAQGFNAARDRLFQLDIWRRRGHGELAAALGEKYVEQDRANRLMLYRGDMEEEWASYGPGVKEAAESFVAGLNAYIEWALAEPGRLPPEFGAHGFEPAKWAPSDIVKFRTHGLFYNVEQEVARARTLYEVSPEAEELRQAREPADPLFVPAGTDLSNFDAETLRTYQLAFAPVSFEGAVDPSRSQEGISGSNNWVVDGSRTNTGRPILANDPHRGVTLPALRYIAHLNTPDLDVIGAGEPGLPGISIGHNQDVAFGLTIWPADVEDLYVYHLDSSDPRRYLGPAGSAPFDVVQERVAVRGADDVTVELQFTQHGPVVHIDHERGIAIALKAVWLERGMAPYMASIGYCDARTGDDFIGALSRWGAPAVNQVFATTDGDWGWHVAAKIPRRRGWDGSLPVPGDGSYEWDGFATSEDLPAERKPKRGWIATANEENLPEDWDNADLTSTYDWYSGGRVSRLKEWLSEDSRVSIESSRAMQVDAKNFHGLEILSTLQGVDLGSSAEEREIAALLEWDGIEHAESRSALIFQIWLRRHLRPSLVTARLEADGISPDQMTQALKLVLKDESFGGDLRGDRRLVTWARAEVSPETMNALLSRTMRDALQEVGQLLGAESSERPWTWGRLHHSAMSNAALADRTDLPDEWKRVGPLPRGGSGDTVGMAGYDATFRQSIGSTFRMVLDVGEWDNSLAMNSPGQSGDPRSDHYADLFAPWVAGEMQPLLFSRAAVEAGTKERILLRPAD